MKAKYVNMLFLLGFVITLGGFSIRTVVAEGAVPQFDYDKLWQQVYEYEKKGKPRSAIDIVNNIYEQAKKEGHKPQMIKALEYGIRLSSRFEEAYYQKGISRIYAELPNFTAPSTQILHSLLADLYMGYYFANRYLILQRTNVVDYELSDMATWDQKLFAEKIFEVLNKSLENPGLLQKTPASDFADITSEGDSLNIFRPALYDLLAHQALDFFRNDEFMSSRPAIRFEVDDPQMLDIADAFSKLKLEEKETFSMKFHALKLYQDLIAFHLNDKDPFALVDLDLNRLDFIYEHAIIDEKDKLLLHTLEQMESMYMGNEAISEVYYHIAAYYNRTGNEYDPLNPDEHSRDKIIAAEYCHNAINEYPTSYGTALCKALLKQILEKTLDGQVGYADIPGKPILSSLTFKNVSGIYLRVIPLDPAEDRNQRLTWDNENKLDNYRQIRPVKQWSVDLPVDADHNSHRTEIAIPPLTEGYYGLMISDNPAFDKSKGVICINNFWITNISYISNEKENGDLMFYILDRMAGNKMPGVKVKVYKEYYENSTREYKLIEAGNYTSDDNGSFSITAVDGHSNRLVMDFMTDIDRFTSPNFFYISQPYKNPDRPADQTFFFTDRSIYRPGQTIYFKGILLERTGENYEIQKYKSTTVQFLDVNNQKVSELQLETNEFGSFNGSFTAPLGILTGNMRILNESGIAGVTVEEYKRPKFEVVFDPVKGSYKLDSKLTVVGKAKAYAGNPVDHAIVKYRVVRDVYYPFRYFWRGYYPQSVQAEIAFGETETQQDGSFQVEFTAIPDRSQPMKYSPVFNYTVYVDVSDISGETHSAQKTVSVGEKSLLIDLELSEEVNREKVKSFSLKTTNLNGEEEAAEVEVEIIRLQAPDRILQDRKWPEPDVFLIAKEEFRELFPDRVYKDENDRSGWDELETVFKGTINTENESNLEPNDFSKWEPGVYKVELKADDVFGETVSVTHFFTLFSPEAKNLPLPVASWFIPLKAGGEPGEKASFLVGTAYKNVNILYEVGSKTGQLKHEWLTLNEEQQILEIPIREEDRGGLGLNIVFVSHNQSYDFAVTVDVPFSNKELDITFESFRDKLLPGQEEQWNVRIRSHKGEKVAAEMLAAMYDASLDAFMPHDWYFNIFNFYYRHNSWEAHNAFTENSGYSFQEHEPYEHPPVRTYDLLDWKDIYSQGFNYVFSREKSMGGVMQSMDGEFDGVVFAEASAVEEEQSITTDQDKIMAPPPDSEDTEKPDEFPVRKNLQETAFFFPDLKTNADGDVIISFTMPEALTRWKMMGFAYTQDLSSGIITKELLTQKDLMIIPNQPRFFREGDEFWFSAKVVNMSEKELQGEATLQLFDAISMKPVDALFGNDDITIDFSASEGNSSYVSWKLNIPEGTGPVLYRVIATAGNFSDGEEMVIPVLKNRMLVTESLPLPINGNETKNFVFDKLANSQTEGSTLKNYSYTLEFTSNPAWYAVQALPYLMEYPHECSEQIFNRVYANGLASHIVNQHPKIKTVFESWLSESPEALLSNLEKNQDLKNVLLEETPWVMQAKNESERKKRIALLFDLNNMDNELSTALNKLQKNQLGNGGWPWFAGGQDNRYITQYIISGMGKMSQLGILDNKNPGIVQMTRGGIRYLDNRMFEDFMRIKDKHKDYQAKQYISRTHIQYLYARSFFMEEYNLLAKHKEAFLYFKEQSKKYWTGQNKYIQGMIALSLHRLGESPMPAVIMASVKEHALYDDEMGMYWRQDAGYYWYEAPIETQALLIEAFDEIMDDKSAVEQMKTWLLKQKQTHDWETTRATADACYALLLRGTNLLSEEGDVRITIGGEDINPDNIDGVEKEAGTGYFQHRWNGNEINTGMANITVSKENDGVAWGAVYWQYFEDLDKITAHASPLNIQKKLFLKSYTSEGPVLTPVNDGDILKPGDKVISRIEIRLDRDMEFIHMKDMRAAALEPENVLSGYHWQGGMGYYESIRDASVNFFFSYMRKGTWVFEYPLNVSQRGTFSNGISTIQCMYAPEFASHSEGVSIKVE